MATIKLSTEPAPRGDQYARERFNSMRFFLGIQPPLDVKPTPIPEEILNAVDASFDALAVNGIAAVNIAKSPVEA